MSSTTNHHSTTAISREQTVSARASVRMCVCVLDATAWVYTCVRARVRNCDRERRGREGRRRANPSALFDRLSHRRELSWCPPCPASCTRSSSLLLTVAYFTHWSSSLYIRQGRKGRVRGVCVQRERRRRNSDSVSDGKREEKGGGSPARAASAIALLSLFLSPLLPCCSGVTMHVRHTGLLC